MIADRLRQINSKLPSGVSLVAVSKFHPVERLMEAYAAGQRLFGENRPQELAAKVPLMPADVQWHFIGHLQTNKLKMVLPYVAMVQSIDSVHLLEAVDQWCCREGKVMDVLLELHLGAEETKHGLSEGEIRAILSESSRFAGVRFRGLMGMATHTENESLIRADFGRIQALMQDLQAGFPGLDGFDQLSIGMSEDWTLALDYGATLIRIGTAIFGEREY